MKKFRIDMPPHCLCLNAKGETVNSRRYITAVNRFKQFAATVVTDFALVLPVRAVY